jgi:hypothetical protein
MAKHCADCKFYHDEPGGTVDGNSPHCRRYPPVHIGPERTKDGFVRVRPELYCGEYKKRKN